MLWVGAQARGRRDELAVQRKAAQDTAVTGSTKKKHATRFGWIYRAAKHAVISNREVLMAIDPVCGVRVNEQNAVPAEQYTSDYEDETLYFCSPDCKEVFESDPEQYMRKSA